MSRRNDPKPPPPGLELEQDDRFPSGKWVGFFLQPTVPGRHEMELILTFSKGTLDGEGRDKIGLFLIKGRYQVEDGRCWWTKKYVGKHDMAYSGYNEGKGIWGTWSFENSTVWKGGFRIWPEGMPDPTKPRIAEEVVEPVGVEEEVAVGLEAVLVPVRKNVRGPRAR